MPTIKRGDATIYYEVYGSGFPIMCFAPGSLGSTIDWWNRAPFNPIEELADQYQVIVMDQRNAGGKSQAPITADTGWKDYTADQIAVADDAGVEQCHVLGQCIGVPFNFAFMQAAPGPVLSAVCLQPSGRIGPRVPRQGGFERWRDALTDHPEATPELFEAMGNNMYTNDFLYTVSREFVKSSQVPVIVFPGDDQAHPHELAVEIDKLSPHSEFVEPWRDGEALESAKRRVKEVLKGHTPVGAAR